MKRPTRTKGFWRVMAATAFASYLLVLAMAASPELHQSLHGDADEADHQCAAVTAMHGQFDRPLADPELVAAPLLSWLELPPVLYAITVARLFLLVNVLEHAPPVMG